MMATLRELVTKLSFKADTKAVKDFENQVDKADDALDGLAKKSGKAEKGLDGVSKKARDAKKPLNDINAGAKTAGLGLGSLNLGLASAGLAFIAFSSNAVKSFGDLEHVFNTIRAVAPEVTPRMKEIEKSVMELGASTTFSSLEVATAYEELAKKGFTAQQMLETMPGLLDAAMASGEDLAQVADIVTSSIQQFNLKTSQSAEVADILTQGANSSSASILSIGDGLIYAGANGRAYNQSLKEMVSALAVLSNAGVKAGDAGSDIAALLANLNELSVSSTRKSRNLRSVLSELGVTVIDSKGKMRPFLTIIQELGNATKGWTDSQRNGLALQIAGKENQKTLNLIMGMSKEKIDAVRKSMDEASGSSKKSSDIMKEGLTPTMEKLGGATDAFNVEVGKMFAPSVIAGLELLTRTMELLAIPFKAVNNAIDEQAIIDKENIRQGIIKQGAIRRQKLKQGFTPEQIAQQEAGQIYFVPNPTEFRKKVINDIKALKNNPQSIGGSSSTTSNKTVNISQTITVQGGTGTRAKEKQAGQNIADHTRVAIQKGGAK